MRRPRRIRELRREGSGRLVAVYDDGTEHEREPAQKPAGPITTKRFRSSAGHGAHGVFIHGQRLT